MEPEKKHNHIYGTAGCMACSEGPELLDEAVHYSNVDLVREINRLKKEVYESSQPKR